MAMALKSLLLEYVYGKRDFSLKKKLTVIYYINYYFITIVFARVVNVTEPEKNWNPWNRNN